MHEVQCIQAAWGYISSSSSVRCTAAREYETTSAATDRGACVSVVYCCATAMQRGATSAAAEQQTMCAVCYSQAACMRVRCAVRYSHAAWGHISSRRESGYIE